MTDRYLFKAKRKDNGDWVYGYYMDRHGCEIIEKGTWLIFDVDENTLCQFTGLYDGTKWEDLTEEEKQTFYKDVCSEDGKSIKYQNVEDVKHLWKGKKIWENDIVKDSRGNIYNAFWQERYYQYSWMCVKSDLLPIGAKWDLWSLSKNNDLEVIGTTFDNPELLGG